MRVDRTLLESIYRAALDAVAAGPALLRALEASGDDGVEPRWIIALGKASPAMVDAALRHLVDRKAAIAGGLIVPFTDTAPPSPEVGVVPGDHPLPGVASARAAEALDELVHRMGTGDDVLVLLSGGATSLVAAPVDGITVPELRETFQALLDSGLDIHAMNRLRKRVGRWGGCRLAAALAHARVRVYALSDVTGDDLGAIGSGPCAPDPTTARELLEMIHHARLARLLPRTVLAYVERVRDGEAKETPKPGDAAFTNVRSTVIAGNDTAIEAALDSAHAAGLDVVRVGRMLSGEASEVGAALGKELVALAAARAPGQPPACVILGGETTVAQGDRHGLGGRCQEIALAAAAVIGTAAGRHEIAVLAAGTDGRDGPTDAAGAIVDTRTVDRIVSKGIDAADALRRHDTHPALDAVDALFRTGATGTNVADLVVGIVSAAS
jgi:hydroxypyruvate reductase